MAPNADLSEIRNEWPVTYIITEGEEKKKHKEAKKTTTKREFPNKFFTSLYISELLKLVIEIKRLAIWKTYLFHQLSWNRFYDLTYS